MLSKFESQNSLLIITDALKTEIMALNAIYIYKM